MIWGGIFSHCSKIPRPLRGAKLFQGFSRFAQRSLVLLEASMQVNFKYGKDFIFIFYYPIYPL